MRSFYVIYICAIVGLFACKDDSTEEPVYPAELFQDKILAYQMDGQEDVWGLQELILIDSTWNIIRFNNSGSIEIAAMKDNTNLSDLEFLRVKDTWWFLGIDNISIVHLHAVHTWKILDFDNESITFDEVFIEERFTLRYLNQ